MVNTSKYAVKNPNGINTGNRLQKTSCPIPAHELVDLYTSGLSTIKIAHILSRHHGMIWMWLNLLDVSMREASPRGSRTPYGPGKLRNPRPLLPPAECDVSYVPTRSIPLTRGQFAIVDVGDYDKVYKLTWFAQEHGGKFYAVSRSGTGQNGPRIHLQRLLFGIEFTHKELHVVHLDDNPLNCSRSNLVVATIQQKNAMRGKTTKPKSSIYKGVCWASRINKWRASIKYDQRYKFLGNFVNEDTAARAYDEAASRVFGKFAYLNFPSKMSEREFVISNSRETVFVAKR